MFSQLGNRENITNARKAPSKATKAIKTGSQNTWATSHSIGTEKNWEKWGSLVVVDGRSFQKRYTFKTRERWGARSPNKHIRLRAPLRWEIYVPSTCEDVVRRRLSAGQEQHPHQHRICQCLGREHLIFKPLSLPKLKTSYRLLKVRNKADFSPEIIQARRKCHDIFKELKEKNRIVNAELYT